MNSRDLLFLLKKEAEDISVENFIKTDINNTQDIYAPGSMQYITNFMTKYDLEIFSEIKNRRDITVVEDIKPDLIKDFIFRIDQYMDENASGQADLKKYIRIISTYLAFVAKRPLHPLGMVMSEGIKVTDKEGKFYCPLKSKQLQERLSLCTYCVSRDMTEMN